MNGERPKGNSSGLRLKVGVFLLVLSCAAPLGGFLVAALDLPTSVKAAIIGALGVGIPELLMIAAVAVLGRDNYERIKSKILALLGRLKPAAKVGRVRYSVGLVFFILPLVPTYIMAYIPRWLPDNSPERLWVNLAADAMFLASLFILGGDFWDKLRALFVREAKAVFPGTGEDAASGKRHP